MYLNPNIYNFIAMNRLLYILLFSICIMSTHGQDYSEKYRPQFHFSPKKGWIGDPDGLVIHEGNYHLFWWGHAISEDLVHWVELPYPMKGGPGNFSYFSGSVIVDQANTSGFGENSMIAIYTKHFPGDSLSETQAISISNDGGHEFHYYEGNPVLDINKIFFRDPQVFWHDQDKMWKMIVSVPDIQQLQIYESKNMKKWEYCSSFDNLGAKNSFWECPDLFELPIIGSNGKKKWVIIIGRGPNRVQYFVGDFDGKHFTPDIQTKNYLKTGKGLEGIIFEDFENNHEERWTFDGDVFTVKKKSKEVSDYLGDAAVTSYSTISNIGKMVSKPFLIEKNAINFLLAGGNNPDSLSINLIVNGKIIRTATGDDTNVLKWNGWDVSNLIGQQAKLEIIDYITDNKDGSLAIDHIMFSDILRNYKLEHAMWLDYGKDNYATRTWRNYDVNKNIGDSVFAISWLGNWEYANKQPTSWGKGFHSIPRVMALKETEIGLQVIQKPIPQLKKLRESYFETKGLIVEGNIVFNGLQPVRNSYEIKAEFTKQSAAEFGINLLVGEGRKLVLSYNPLTSTITLDRTNCTDFVSDKEFNRYFSTKMNAPIKLNDDILSLHLFIDQSSIEVFTNDGEIVLSALTFPSEKQLGIEFFSKGGSTEISELNMWELKSIWDNN